ncbi:M14 metallopeptidase family protein [Zhouia sp. PK063]|uniref:M14 metallopeptidase family protein n=1 Tax=Zhouia sp. PK063 TaxID=3373602 RepID=UPI0037BDD5E7
MKFKFTFLGIFISFLSFAQLKTPSEFLGYELGTRFTRDDKVVDYFNYVATQLPQMVKVIKYGETNEHRDLVMAYVSTQENIQNLEQIREAHLQSIKGKTKPEIAIVWLSYNVHGNEAVSSEAAMKTLYELVTEKKIWLQNTVVIIDPCVNPDGHDRYVNWYNQYVNYPNTIDINSKEHHEPWINGRPNHYMFDLNRDWAWLTQVESQARIKQYNKWLPHIHVDFHEQGINSPYYFAPGAEPIHNAITKWQRNFQDTIGKNHAKYFDKNGWFYFTKEEFDLFYPSYGDTYPLFNGAIGMTYEQGGSGKAGLAVTMKSGDTLTLKDRIAHHYTTGLSTVEVASKNAKKINEEFEKFYLNKTPKYKNYVLSGNTDKIKALTDLLDKQEISYAFANNVAVKGLDYNTGKESKFQAKGKSLVVTTNQTKSTLVDVLFQPTTQLNDSLTYDITAWALPYAYGLNAVATNDNITTENDNSTKINNTISNEIYAYVTDRNSMNDARFMSTLLKANIKIRYNEVPFSFGSKTFERGSMIITQADNKNIKNFTSILKSAADKFQKTLTPTNTGWVDNGHDFGSSSVKLIPKVKVAVLTGNPTSTLGFGEIWHFFEQQLQYPLTTLDTDYFKGVDLSAYQVLILPEGHYTTFFDEGMKMKLENWVKQGGKLIAIGNAVGALSDFEGVTIKEKSFSDLPVDEKSTNTPEPYNVSERDYIKKLITGAVFKAKVDNTNPLAYGYSDTYFTLKLRGDAYDFLPEGNAVYIENENKPFTGFAGSDAQKLVKNSLIYGFQSLGRGDIIYLADDPLFRGFWENGKLFFVNAVFMIN